MSKRALKRKARSLVALLIIFSIVLMPISVIAEDGGGEAGAGGDGGGSVSDGGSAGTDNTSSGDTSSGTSSSGNAGTSSSTTETQKTETSSGGTNANSTGTETASPGQSASDSTGAENTGDSNPDSGSGTSDTENSSGDTSADANSDEAPEDSAGSGDSAGADSEDPSGEDSSVGEESGTAETEEPEADDSSGNEDPSEETAEESSLEESSSDETAGDDAKDESVADDSNDAAELEGGTTEEDTEVEAGEETKDVEEVETTESEEGNEACETDSDETVSEDSEGDEDEADVTEGVEESTEAGNSYEASITPNGIVRTGFENEFTITFKEVGDKTIGSVKINLPSLIKAEDWSFDADTGITAPEGKSWTGGLVGYVLEMWAKDAASYIDNSDAEGLSATFFGKPQQPTGHEFTYEVKTDAEGIDSDGSGEGVGVGSTVNNPASGENGSKWVAVRDTIQETIEAPAVANRDFATVHVNPGIYQEQVVINKNLNLIGIDNPVIQAPDTSLTYKVEESSYGYDPVIFAYGGTLDANNVAKGGETISVNISGLIIDGNARVPSSSRSTGILLRNIDEGVVKNNTIQNMALLGKESFGISAFGIYHLLIDGNHVSGFQRGGIGLIGNMDGTGGYADITNNTIIAPPKANSWAPNGIQVSWGASGTIINNNVSSSAVDNDDWAASAILIPGSSDVLIKGNNVSNSDIGIGIAGYGDLFGGRQLSSNNKIIGNKIYDCDTGVAIQGDVEHTTIIGNTIHNNNYGADSYDYPVAWGYGVSIPVYNVFKDNKIYNNTYGLRVWDDSTGTNPDGFIVDALNNWWGDASGPYHDATNLGGLGNPVSDNVLFDPWWINEEMTRDSNYVEPTPGGGGDFGGGDFGFEFDFPTLPSAPTPPSETTVPPAAPLTAPLQSLVVPPADPQTEAQPLITVEFVEGGTNDDLAAIVAAYDELKAYFDENYEQMSDEEYAQTYVDLTVAWAAILARQAALLAEQGSEFDLEAVNEAYNAALAALAEYGDQLGAEQLAAAEEVLAAVAELIAQLPAE